MSKRITYYSLPLGTFFAVCLFSNQSHDVKMCFCTGVADILTPSVIYYRKDLLKAQRNLIYLCNSMNRKI